MTGEELRRLYEAELREEIASVKLSIDERMGLWRLLSASRRMQPGEFREEDHAGVWLWSDLHLLARIRQLAAHLVRGEGVPWADDGAATVARRLKAWGCSTDFMTGEKPQRLYQAEFAEAFSCSVSGARGGGELRVDDRVRVSSDRIWAMSTRWSSSGGRSAPSTGWATCSPTSGGCVLSGHVPDGATTLDRIWKMVGSARSRGT